MNKQRIGIYAGAFDPVHDGHVQFARDAVAKAGLDKVYFLVEPNPRHKQGVKAFEHRVAMVRLAIARYPELGSIVLDQARFTVHDTWPVLEKRFHGADIALLMGSDVFMRLSHWPRVDELMEAVRFVVGVRSGHKAADFAAHVRVLEHTKHMRLHYDTFVSKLSSQSSTHIRKSLRGGIVPAGIDHEVAEYIRKEGLYLPGSDT